MENFNSVLFFVGVGCNTDIKIEPEVSKLLNLLKKPTSITKKDKRNDCDITVANKQHKTKVLDGLVAIETNYTSREITKHLHNIRTILLNSNATPIRSYNGIGYTCCFCSEQYPLPKDLKKHTLENHDKTAKVKFMQGCPLSTYVVKIDITDLSCELCGTEFKDLQKFVEHLQNDHHKTLHTDINDHILPFKFEGEGFTCVICSKNFERFKAIHEHMNIHHRNFICEVCDSPFVNKRTLKSHMSRHKQGEFNCSFCPKVFDTQNKKTNHEKFVHTGDQRRNICPYCKEKFLSYAKKNEHMVELHGVEPLVLKCKACDKTFNRRDKLTLHTRRDHLLERRFECDHCDMKFYGKRDLNTHMVKHTGVKQYRCEVCLKAFGRRHTLREHLRIHADDRRFKCEHCGQTFVQKCSWKSHMRSKHEEFVLNNFVSQ